MVPRRLATVFFNDTGKAKKWASVCPMSSELIFHCSPIYNTFFLDFRCSLEYLKNIMQFASFSMLNCFSLETCIKPIFVCIFSLLRPRVTTDLDKNKIGKMLLVLTIDSGIFSPQRYISQKCSHQYVSFIS